MTLFHFIETSNVSFESQVTQAHDLSTVLFSVFIDFVWKFAFVLKIPKYSHKRGHKLHLPRHWVVLVFSV